MNSMTRPEMRVMYDANKKCPNCGGSLSDRQFPKYKRVQRKCYVCGETYYDILGEEHGNTNTDKDEA